MGYPQRFALGPPGTLFGGQSYLLLLLSTIKQALPS
jgi:hypothetical protein